MRFSISLVLIFPLLALGCKREEAPPPEPKDPDVLGSPLRPAEESIGGTQYVKLADYRLEVGGLVKKPASHTYEQVLAKPKRTMVVEHHCIKGWMERLRYEGVLVRDLFEAKPGAKTVVFEAVDGYSTSFPLEYVLDNDVILAYRMNGERLPPGNGFPFQLVADEKWAYKWIKWVAKIELSSDPHHRGYWESRGYSHTANVDEPFVTKGATLTHGMIGAPGP